MTKRARSATATATVEVYVPPPVLPGQLRLPGCVTPDPSAVLSAVLAPVPPSTKSDSYGGWERDLLATADLDNWGPETPPALRPPPAPPSSVPYPPARACAAHGQALCVRCSVEHQHARLAKGTPPAPVPTPPAAPAQASATPRSARSPKPKAAASTRPAKAARPRRAGAAQ